MKEMSKVKILERKNETFIKNERMLLSKMFHPFIVNMHYAFQDNDNLYLVVDYLSGGDLRYHYCFDIEFNEEQTKFIICCIYYLWNIFIIIIYFIKILNQKI